MLPFSVNEVTQIGLEAIAALFAYGASGRRLLLRAKPRHDVAGLTRTIALAEPILAGLGFGTGRIATIETDDPELLGAALRAIPAMAGAPRPASFLPLGDKRECCGLRCANSTARRPNPWTWSCFRRSAPFGAVEIDTAGCTLCLSCVCACPTGALRTIPSGRAALCRRGLRAVRIVQGDLPGKGHHVETAARFPCGGRRESAERGRSVLLHPLQQAIRRQEHVERVVAKLADKHWMFKESPERLDLIKMCDDCRVAFVSEKEFDPYAAPRAPVRTTDDYLRERDESNAREGRRRAAAAMLIRWGPPESVGGRPPPALSRAPLRATGRDAPSPN